MLLYSNGSLIADEITVADDFKSKLIGLLGKKMLRNGEGLILMRCRSIHCFFMSFTIDAVYLSKEMEVLEIETLKPWKIGKYVRKAEHVLELSEGIAAKSIKVGDLLELRVK